MTDTSPKSTPAAYGPTQRRAAHQVRGESWLLFAAIIISLLGVLNVIYGIAAIGDSRVFVEDATYILSGLNTYGWILLLLGVIQFLAAYSILSGGQFGRWFGIAVAVLNSVAALMSLPAFPFWSLAVFALGILVLYGLATYGGEESVID
jgi:hypothetical protein